MANRTPTSSTKNIPLNSVTKNPIKKSSKTERKKQVKPVEKKVIISQPKINTTNSSNTAKEKAKVNPKKLPNSKKEIKPKIIQTEKKITSKIPKKKEVKRINKSSSNKIEPISKPIANKDNNAEPKYPQDTIFLTNYLKILDNHKVYIKDIDLIKLKKILPLLDKTKKDDLIKQLFLDVNTTLNKMHKILEIPKENIMEDFHKCLTNPEVPHETVSNPITFESFDHIKTKSTNQIRTILCDYYNTIFLKIHKQLKLL